MLYPLVSLLSSSCTPSYHSFLYPLLPQIIPSLFSTPSYQSSHHLLCSMIPPILASCISHLTTWRLPLYFQFFRPCIVYSIGVGYPRRFLYIFLRLWICLVASSLSPLLSPSVCRLLSPSSCYMYFLFLSPLAHSCYR